MRARSGVSIVVVVAWWSAGCSLARGVTPTNGHDAGSTFVDGAIDGARPDAVVSDASDAFVPDDVIVIDDVVVIDAPTPDTGISDAYTAPDAYSTPDAYVSPDAWTPSCTMGTTRCNGTMLETCNGAGMFGGAMACPLGCIATAPAHCGQFERRTSTR